jgi:hypothetical protein
MEDSEPLLVCASLSFDSTVPSSCLENQQALMPSYGDSIRVYLECLALTVPRKVSTWKARPAFFPGRKVRIDVNRRRPEDWRRGLHFGLSYNPFRTRAVHNPPYHRKIRESAGITKSSALPILLGSRWGSLPPSIARMSLCDRSGKVGASRSGPARGCRGQKGCHHGHNDSDKTTRGFA